MQLLEFIISPLTWVFQTVYEGIFAATGNYGISIILLSLAATLITSPIARKARELEQKEKVRQDEMAPLVAAARERYKGRDRFEKIDEIYQAHGYHPIKSMASLAPLLLQLPFLLAALFMLVNYPPLAGQGFLFVQDLSKPDALALLPGSYALNILPIALTAIALLDSFTKPEATAQSRRRFLIVSLVLLALIYPFPAAVCLYWLCSNFWSLIRSQFSAVTASNREPAPAKSDS
ncbi:MULTISPECIES: membrane protein insertase YidC [unclassified Mesorhizobium]|uniref:membrane protein insertase YidC n=1 Tax=unclassified Mesorhizobium TaxID=325217 RepID=UPI003014E482